MQDTILSHMLKYCLDPSIPGQIRLYGIEVTSGENKRILGNIYEYDPPQYAQFAAQNVQPYSALTLTFAGGKKLCVPREAIKGQKWGQLKSEHGEVVWERCETTNEAAVQSALYHERALCNAVPTIDFPVYLQKLGEQQIQAIANRIFSGLQSLKGPNCPNRAMKLYVAPVPYEFCRAENQKIHQLTLKLRELVDDPHLYITQFPHRSGLFAVTDRPELSHLPKSALLLHRRKAKRALQRQKNVRNDKLI